MTFTPEISTINQTVQVGVETTPGTAVAANKRLDNYDFQFGIKGDFKKTGGTGRKYDSTQQLNAEWVEGTVAGTIDFNSIIYLLAGAMGIATPVAHGSSAVAKDWIYDAILTGARQPQTYSFEQGDSVRAHKFAYGLITKFGYKFTRKTDASISGSVLAQAVSDGITMTASPTPVVLSPATGQEFDLYLDSMAANIGTTQVLKSLSVDFAFDGIYGPAWYINRANPSYSSHVDLKPNTMVKFQVAADAAGMASLGDMRTGITKYMRVEALGPVIDNNQTVTLGVQSTGTFTLTYKGQTTTALAFGATGATVNTAFQLLSTVGTACTVTGGAGGPYTLAFSGALAADTTPVTGNFSALTTPSNAAITQTQIYARIWHDMAIKIGQPTNWGDSNGIYMIEWDCGIFEDSVWGHSHMATITNLLTAL